MEIQKYPKPKIVNELHKKEISIPWTTFMEMEKYQENLGCKIMDLPVFFLEYSVKQKCFHVDDLWSVVAKNRDCCLGGRSNDYVILEGPLSWEAVWDSLHHYWQKKLPC